MRTKRQFFIIFKLIFLLLLFACSTQMCFSQTEDSLTEYEKGRLLLAYQALEKVRGMSPFSYSRADIVQMAFIEHLLKNKDLSTPRAMMESLEEVISDLCGVASFVPGENYMEMVYLDEYRSICEWYADELTKLDQSISADDLAFEKEKIKKRAMANLIEKQIKKDFIVWNKKKETEKTIEYEKRLTEMSEWAFDSICQEAIINNWGKNLSVVFYNYDADNEVLPMKLFYEDGEGGELCALMYQIHVSPDWLKALKSCLFDKSYTDIVSEGVYQNYLFPSKIIFRPHDYMRDEGNEDGYCVCKTITEGVNPLIISFDKLGIENKQLAGVQRKASFEQFYTWKKELEDSIKESNTKSSQLANSLGYGLSANVHHEKSTLFLNYFVGLHIPDYAIDRFHGVSENYGRYCWKNMINPSQDSFERFMSGIHQFYNENVKHFELCRELKAIFPEIHYDGSWQNTINRCYSELEWSVKTTPYGKRLMDSQPGRLVALSASQYTLFQELYTAICEFYVEREPTIIAEYNKNRQYFTSPNDFIKAYMISGNYKSELKARKTKH